MPLGKQAKVLSKAQVDRVLRHVGATRHPVRNRAIILLSVKAGLRAKEIASLTWDMVSDADGNVGTAIQLTNAASKGRSGRIIPMNGDLRSALVDLTALRTARDEARRVIVSERGRLMSCFAAPYWNIPKVKNAAISKKLNAGSVGNGASIS
jgi:integrase